MRKLIIVCTIGCLVLALSDLANADTIYVAIDGNDVMGDGSFGNPYETIQKGIDETFSGDTVVVAPGTYTGDNNRDIDFGGKAITLRSQNGPETCIIDCEGSQTDNHRGFNFNRGEDANSIICGFTVKNGWADVGAGIYCSGASPAISQCIISKNTAWHHGGGIYCETSNTVITNCVLRYNKSTQGHGGGIFCLRSNPSINTCVINYNSAGNSGGGLFNNKSSPTLVDCQITENYAGHHGGAICNINGSTPIQTGCTYYDNQAGYPGNQIYRYGDTKQNQTTLNKIVARESSDNLLLKSFDEHSSARIYYVNGDCGNDDWTGLSQGCADPNGPKSTIQAAINDSNDGDTIIVYPGIYYEYLLIQSKDISLRSIDPCDPHIVETTIVDGGGGNTVLRISDANAVIEGLTVANGSADPNGGGGIYCEGSKLIMSRCVVTGNRTINGQNGVVDGGKGGDGAGLCIYDSVINLVDSNITWNTAGAGGSSYHGNAGQSGNGGGLYVYESVISITDCNITGNASGKGGISDYSPGDGGDGGGIYVASSQLNVANCAITANRTGNGEIVDHTGQKAGAGGFGGGIYCSTDSNLVIYNSRISENNTGYGGQSTGGGPGGGTGGKGAGIYCSSAKITSCIIEKNVSGEGGQGEYIGAKGGNGGGIYCFSGNLQIIDSNIIRNQTGLGGWSYEHSGDGGSGAGIYSSESALLIVQECNIAQNATADGGARFGYYGPGPAGNGGDGGGICCYSGLIIESRIINNSTGAGGYGHDRPTPGNGGNGAGIFTHTGTIENCYIQGNTTGSGGSMRVFSGKAGSGGEGAGIFCDSGHINNCVITANMTGKGGGIDYDSSTLTLSGGDGGNGGGVYGLSSTITNCTIANNITGLGEPGWPLGQNYGMRGYGGGVFANINTLVNNTIICSNAADDINGQDCSKVTYSNICDGNCAGGLGNIIVDPCFVDSDGPDNDPCTWEDNDYHLLPYSLCIDAGDPSSDFGLEPEPDGGRIDMGAYGNTPEATSKGGLTIESYNLVSKTRVGRTLFDYIYTVTMANRGPNSVCNVYLALLDASGNVSIIDANVSFEFIGSGESAISTVNDTFKIRVNRSTPINVATISWRATFEFCERGTLGNQAFTNNLVLEPILGDFTGEGIVAFEDFAILADQWLQVNSELLADIAPAPSGDGIVNFLDFAVMAESWGQN